MFETASAYSADKSQFYSQLQQEVAALIDPSLPLVSNLSNISSLLFWAFHDKAVARPVNWVGFYLLPSARKDVLLLGPFHGRVACTTIKLGKGVCGTSAAEKKTILVPDVHAFAGHIACDSASESEIVVPLIHQDGSLLGVLDLDSTIQSGFDEQDQIGLETIVAKIVTQVGNWKWD